MERICKKVLSELGWPIQKVAGEEFALSCTNLADVRSQMQETCAKNTWGLQNKINNKFFFEEIGADPPSLPLVKIFVSGLRFGARNQRLDARIARGTSIIDSLIRLYSEPEYVRRVKQATTFEEIFTAMNDVAVEVSRLHD